jgi:hypothetical protein
VESMSAQMVVTACPNGAGTLAAFDPTDIVY